MSIASDSSPLIFLSKIEQQELPKRLFDGPFYLPRRALEEIFTDSLPLQEKERLKKSLSYWKGVLADVDVPAHSGLSLVDWEVYAVARKVKAQWVLADDKLLRSTLRASGFRVLGTLGLILMGTRHHIFDKKKAKAMAATLIENHHLYIDAHTYRLFLTALEPV